MKLTYQQLTDIVIYTSKLPLKGETFADILKCVREYAIKHDVKAPEDETKATQ